MASIFGFQIQNVVHFKGRDGEGCQGDIYYNGEKVGWYNDMANGGMADIDFWQGDVKCREKMQAIFDRAVKDYFEKYPLTGIFKDLEPDGELFMDALVELTDCEKEYILLSSEGRKYMVTYENEQGTEVNFVASTNPYLYDIKKLDKTAFNVKLYKSLEDFIIK